MLDFLKTHFSLNQNYKFVLSDTVGQVWTKCSPQDAESYSLRLQLVLLSTTWQPCMRRKSLMWAKSWCRTDMGNLWLTSHSHHVSLLVRLAMADGKSRTSGGPWVHWLWKRETHSQERFRHSQAMLLLCSKCLSKLPFGFFGWQQKSCMSGGTRKDCFNRGVFPLSDPSRHWEITPAPPQEAAVLLLDQKDSTWALIGVDLEWYSPCHVIVWK